MSPRPVRLRKVSNPPVISGFKPYGNKNGQGEAGGVFLKYEEYEALRLCDYEMLNHHQASLMMGVSRPTLTRIYAKARYKIAEAIVKGNQIIIEGGKVYFDSDWYICLSCGCYFTNPEKEEEILKCPLCGDEDISNCAQAGEHPDQIISGSGCNSICVCPACGFEQQHQHGHPCRQEACPECGGRMYRKGSSYIKSSKTNK